MRVLSGIFLLQMRMNVRQEIVGVITTAPIYLGAIPALALRAIPWIAMTGHAMVWVGGCTCMYIVCCRSQVGSTGKAI